MIHHPLDSVFQQDNVKVDKESDRDVQQAEMRKQLRLVHRVDSLFALELYYYFSVYH
jgi:hypothetical protein